MPASDFLNILQSTPQVPLAILKRLTGQVRSLTDRIYDFNTLPVTSGIHVELLRLSKIHPTVLNICVILMRPL